MMTDDDIKYLEGWHEGKISSSDAVVFIPALLARLNAAEDAVHQAYRCDPTNREYYIKWCQVAGKEEGQP